MRERRSFPSAGVLEFSIAYPPTTNFVKKKRQDRKSRWCTSACSDEIYLRSYSVDHGRTSAYRQKLRETTQQLQVCLVMGALFLQIKKSPWVVHSREFLSHPIEGPPRIEPWLPEAQRVAPVLVPDPAEEQRRRGRVDFVRTSKSRIAEEGWRFGFRFLRLQAQLSSRSPIPAGCAYISSRQHSV